MYIRVRCWQEYSFKFLHCSVGSDPVTTRRLKLALSLCLLFLSGCALKVKNIKPNAPYDFMLLDRMAKFSQAAYADDATIKALCQPTFDNVYIKVIPSTNNKYFLA